MLPKNFYQSWHDLQKKKKTVKLARNEGYKLTKLPIKHPMPSKRIPGIFFCLRPSKETNFNVSFRCPVAGPKSKALSLMHKGIPRAIFGAPGYGRHIGYFFSAQFPRNRGVGGNFPIGRLEWAGRGPDAEKKNIADSAWKRLPFRPYPFLPQIQAHVPQREA